MKKDEVDKIRWDQYNISVPIDLALMEECLEIINTVNRRKLDVINWEEKRQLNEITKRSGHLLHKGEELLTEAGAINDKTAGASSPKEKELMSGFSDILKGLEQIDEKK